MIKEVSCVGLGYVGLPTAVVLASEGVRVWGYDVNKMAVDMINNSQAHIQETNLDELLKQVVSDKMLVADTKPHPADAFLIAVPTPFKENKTPDMQYVVSATRSIASVLKKGNIIVLESTSPVGSTEMIRDVLKEERPDLFEADKDHLYFAYCPERILPGNTIRELRENSRCIGGLTKEASEIAASIYKNFCEGELILTNSRTAEMVKLGENSFRDINIAYANEMAKICIKNNVNVHEFIALANHHPRVNILSPGIGVGGHCIPVDPWFLVADNPNEAQLLKNARIVNDNMPQYYADKIKAKFKDKKTAKVTVLGLCYKPDVDDFRCSPSVDLLNLLADDKKFTVNAHDFFVDCMDERQKNKDVAYHDNLGNAVKDTDFIIIATPHQGYRDYDFSCIITEENFIDPSGVIKVKTKAEDKDQQQEKYLASAVA